MSDMTNQQWAEHHNECIEASCHLIDALGFDSQDWDSDDFHLPDMLRDVAKKLGEHPSISAFVKERFWQVTDLDYTADHDDAHNRGELSRAAICYAEAAQFVEQHGRAITGGLRYSIKTHWPWSEDSLHLSADPLHNLQRSAALLMAEYDRISRLPKRLTGESNG